MLKKTVTYEDFNGTERTDTLWFHLSKAELTEMELTTNGGLTNLINRISETEDIPSIVKLFKEFLLKAYGAKSDDGKRFIKKRQDGSLLADEFVETLAYETIFMQLLENPVEMAEFFKGLIPSDIAKRMQEKNLMPETPSLN